MKRAAPLLPLLLGAAEGAAPSGRAAFSGADPSALVEGGRVWLYPTGSGDRLQAWVSADLVRWRRAATLLRRSDIAWLRGDTRHQLWAPHMAAANGRYYLYYSVGPQEPGPSRIGVATCATPQGPCTDLGRPLLDGQDATAVAARPSGACTDGMRPTGTGRFRFEAIDPMVFVDPRSGDRLLYAGGSNGSTLRVFVLAPDMVTIVREVAIDQPPCFTEGAWMHERWGVYYLSYSSGHWDRADYSVRYATAPHATGPWTYRGTILRSQGGLKGPGHHAFFADPRSGVPMIAYHRWEGQRNDGPYRNAHRTVAVALVTYASDGAIAPIVIPGTPAPNIHQ